MGVSPLVDVDQNHPMMETPRWRCSSHRGIKSGPWKNKTCDKAVVHHVINHRTRCQTIFSGSFVFVFLMFLQGAWQEGSANQRGWISMFELKQLWNMKYIAFRHISQRNQLEISLETSKHLETSRELGPWDHELCKSTKWFCFKGTTGCQARCHGHGPLWWMSLLGWLSSRISEWNYPLTLKTPSMGLKKHRSNLLTNIHHEWPLHINFQMRNCKLTGADELPTNSSTLLMLQKSFVNLLWVQLGRSISRDNTLWMVGFLDTSTVSLKKSSGKNTFSYIFHGWNHGRSTRIVGN